MSFDETLQGKRILFVLPALQLGGAERQALHLASYLKRNGCDVCVWGHGEVGTLVAETCAEVGIPLRMVRSFWPCRKRHLPRFVFRALHFCLALRRLKPDVILAYCQRPCVSVGLTWRWSAAKVCIWSQRGVDDLRGDVVERYAYHRVSGVICNAKHEVDYLRQVLGETAATVSVIYNGVDMAPAKRDRAQWRLDLGLHEDAVVVVMLANVGAAPKDHPTLLCAWRALLDRCLPMDVPPQLVLAGAPREGYSEILALSEELRLGGSIVFAGQVQDVSGLLAACDIGVLTSTHEGLPNAVIEYMRCGLPVLATDIPGNRELLGEVVGRVLCPCGSVEAFAEMLAVMVGDSKWRAQLGLKNRQRAVARYSVDVMCAESGRVIAGLMHGSRSG